MAQATRTVQPSADFISMMRQVPMMDDRELAGMTASPQFGALALTEISKRERMRLMDAAQKQAAAGGGQTLADRKIAELAQQKFMDKLAADERMGINNIVAQAEQGGLEFGSPYGAGAIGESGGEMPMGAGGGIVAFDRGGRVNQAGERYYDDPELGRVYEDGSLGYLALGLIPAIGGAAARLGPMAIRGLSGLRGLAARYPKTAAGLGVASGIPFGLGLGGDDEVEGVKGFSEASDEVYQGTAAPKGSGEGKAKGKDKGVDRDVVGRESLDLERDPRRILEQIRNLEKEQGLGEYGAEAKRIREGRKARVEETLGRALESEPYLAGAEAAGQVRPTGRRGLAGLLDVAAPAIAAMGKSAAGIQRQKTEALDKLAEGEERLALAQEQFLRGDVRNANTQANQAKKDIFTGNLQLRQLASLDEYRKLQAAAARARGVKYPTAEMAQFQKEAATLNQALVSGQLTPKQYQQAMTNWEQRRRQTLSMSMLGGLEVGTRDSEED